MKILWIVNTIFPYPSKILAIKENAFGGWLIGLAEELRKCKEIELAVATVYNGKEMKKIFDGNITYYLIPGKSALKYDKKWEVYWKEINKDFIPDLAHIHGTEFAHGLAFVNACPNVKSVVAIQGLVSAYSEVYEANIPPKDIIRNITIRDILKRDTIFQAKEKMRIRGLNEKKLLQKVRYIIGRTNWDYANVKAINNEFKYYFLNETLRKSFYTQNWDIKNIERHSIFVGQAWYPIKGMHMIIKAVNILKKSYPDVKVYVAGDDFVTIRNIKEKIRQSGYSKYINKLIKKYDLEKNIVFTGVLTEQQMLERFLKSNVFVCGSIIENESNALSEASILGMPVVCSYVGGIPDRVQNDVNGYTYPFTEYSMLAEYILKYFENDQLCIKHGIKAKEEAKKRNDGDKNLDAVIKIYKEIIQKEE